MKLIIILSALLFTFSKGHSQIIVDNTYRLPVSSDIPIVSDTFYVSMLIGDSVLKIKKGYLISFKFARPVVWLDWQQPPQTPSDIYLDEHKKEIKETVWQHKILYPIFIATTIHAN